MSEHAYGLYPFSALTSWLAVMAALASGRAIAAAWRPWWVTVCAALPLAAAARLLDFMLVGQTTGPVRAIVAFAMTGLAAYAGFLWHRERQMKRQYPSLQDQLDRITKE